LVHRLLSNVVKTILTGGCLVAIAACGSSDKDTSSGGDCLVKIGKATLTQADLVKDIPGGLSADDSVKYVRAYIRRWIEDKLISEVAVHEIDMTEINQLVDKYRTQLIRQQYCQQMFDAHDESTISPDTIKVYYEEHKSEFKLERPLVKGVYLKVPDDARNLATIRKLYKSTKTDDIDKLEKEVLTTAIHYDYFRNRWIDWEQVELRIPYDFGAADAYLHANRNLELHNDGFYYLLVISDYLPSGSPMPLEAATPQIERRLLVMKREAYESTLIKELYDHALDNNKMKINCTLE
jgi:hypothetical protein